jgi:hypothetical protein
VKRNDHREDDQKKVETEMAQCLKGEAGHGVQGRKSPNSWQDFVTVRGDTFPMTKKKLKFA